MQLAAVVPLTTEAPISLSLTCNITHITAMTMVMVNVNLYSAIVMKSLML